MRHSPSSKGTLLHQTPGDTGPWAPARAEDPGALAAVSRATSLASCTPNKAKWLWVWRQRQPRGGGAGSHITTQGGRGGVCPPQDLPARHPGQPRPGSALVPEDHQGDGRPVRAAPCHPKSARAALLKVGEEKEHSGTMRGPYAWGDAEPTSETLSMGPSAAQGAGCRLAEGRRISQLFSVLS